jgi:putative tricarboxylic transport membrane protein
VTKARDPDVVGALAIVVIGLVSIAAALTTPDPGFGVVGPAVLPTALGVLVVVCGLWLARDALAARRPVALEPLDTRPLLSSVIATAAYLALFVPLGFVLSSAAYLLAEARILGSARPVRDLIASVFVVVGLYLLFVRFLGIDLPRGPLPF